MSTNNFLLGAQHAQLAEAHVEGRALEGSIGLLHHNHVDSPCESGRVESAVQLLHRHKHRLRQLAHDIHGLGLQTTRGEVRGQWRRKVSALADFWSTVISTPVSTIKPLHGHSVRVDFMKE